MFSPTSFTGPPLQGGWWSELRLVKGAGQACSFSPLLVSQGGGFLTCDLREGSGTTLVEQMRPAEGWRRRCSLFRSCAATKGTSFGVEQMNNVVCSSRSA